MAGLSHPQMPMVAMQPSLKSGREQLPEGEALSDKQRLLTRFAAADSREQAKILKSLSPITSEDEVIERRQKHGQLRFGDVVLLAFQ